MSRVPRLHVVTTRAILERADFARTALELLAAGEVALHLRAEGSSGRLLLERALELAPEALPGRLLVNDRVDVAVIAGTGAHLPEAGLTPAQARTILGKDPLLGRSVHEPSGPADARDAASEEPDAVPEGRDAPPDGNAAFLDFVFYGHVFATAFKPDLPPRGLAGLDRAARRLSATGLPLIAIGGITPGRVGEVLSGGAYGVAAISGIWDAPDRGVAVARYLEALAVHSRA
jgi:thiamine-phosphate diphosphorylase